MRRSLILRILGSVFLCGIVFCSFSCMLGLSEHEEKEQKQEFELTVLSRHESIYFEWKEPEGVEFTNIRVECVSTDDGANNPKVYDKAIKESVKSYIRTGVTNDKEYCVNFTATGSDDKEYKQELTVVPHHKFPIVERATAITFDGYTYVSFGISPKNIKTPEDKISARIYDEGLRVETIAEYEVPAYEKIDESVTDNYVPFDKYYGFIIDEEFKEGAMLQIRTADTSLNETVVYEVEVKSVNLPVIDITVDWDDNRAERLKSKKAVSGNLSVLNAGKHNAEDIEMTIKGRGNSSWTNTPKKSYTIKFDKKQTFLGMPKNKTFALVASYFDKTLLRNMVAYDLSCEVFDNMTWAPWQENVNLFINGVYQGVYGLVESVKIANGRVPLNDVNIENYKKGTNFDEYGYLLEVNTRLDEEFNFVTNYDSSKSIEENRDCVAFSLKEPTSSDIDDVLSLRYGKTEGMKLAESVKDYIKTYINDVHAKLYSDDFADVDSDNYYGDYLDVDSFVDWWIMEEFARNTDSNFFASCFMYYDPKDYLIHMGPVWDFDLGFGNSKVNIKTSDFLADEKGVLENDAGQRYAYRGNWLCRLKEDPAFMNKVSARWKEVKSLINMYFREDFTYRVEDVEKDAELNFVRWNILGTQIWLSPDGYEYRDTYQSELDYLIQWKNRRIDWLNSVM